MSKKALFFLATSALMVIASSCSQAPKGFLAGVYGKSKPETTPYGMVYIPRGSFTMGPNDQSATWGMQVKQRTISLDAYWMDETEITNGEYKQFICYVRDSLALRNLSHLDDETEAAKYFRTVKVYKQDDPDTILNWKAKIPWGIKWKEDDELTEMRFNAVEEMYFSGVE